MHSMEKKIYLGLLICLLVSVIGTSFAYFVSTVSVNGSGSSTNMKTTDLIGVQYDAGSSGIDITNAIPSTGSGEQKGFAVKVTPTTGVQSVTYAIKLNITTNTFVKCNDSNYKASEPNKNACTKGAQELVYTLTDENNTVIATGDLLEKDGSLLLKKVTKNTSTETTYNYNLSILYKDTGADQNHNMNKSFVGSLSVEFAEAD